jgi:hypothetical protein
MSPSRRVPRRRLLRPLGLALGALALGLAAPAAPAQSLGPDPYQPFNAMYKPFIYPTAPPNGGIPNMGRLDLLGGAPSASRGFSDYLNSVGIGTANPFGRPGGGVSRFTPYYQSYRQYDEAFGRRSNPNSQDDFYRDQADRHRRYITALRERDPKKRQELLKEVESEGRQAARAADDPGRFRDYREAQAPDAAARAAGAAAPAAARGPAATAPRPAPARPGGAATPRPRTGAGDALDPGPLPLDAIRLPRPPAARRGVLPEGPGAEAEPGDADGPSPSRILERSRYYSNERRPRRSLTERLRLPEDEPGLDAADRDADAPGRDGTGRDRTGRDRTGRDDLGAPRRGLADEAPPAAPRGLADDQPPAPPRGSLEDPAPPR